MGAVVFPQSVQDHTDDSQSAIPLILLQKERCNNDYKYWLFLNNRLPAGCVE
jgi:hypothetical protein